MTTARGETPQPCVERFSVQHADSVLVEQRRVGPGWDDFPTRFAAASVDHATFVPVEAVRGFEVAASPVLFFTPDRRSAVVDERFFSDLTVADPTRMRTGDSATVGTVRAGAREALGGRGVLRLLIAAGVIRVYWHVEAEVCVSSEAVAPDGGYEAAVSGTHVYFTNDRNEDGFAFTFRVAPGGAITVVGR